MRSPFETEFVEFYSNLCIGWSKNKTEQENKTQPVEFWSKVRHGLVGIHKWSHSALRSDQVCPELGPTWATDDQRNRLESSSSASSVFVIVVIVMRYYNSHSRRRHGNRHLCIDNLHSQFE